MKSSLLMTFTTAALLAAGSAVACPGRQHRNHGGNDGVYEVSTPARDDVKCPPKDKSGNEGVYEVGNRESDGPMQVQEGPAPEGERPARPGRGEGPRGERGQGGPNGPGMLLRGLDLTEDQQEAVNTIMAEAREKGQALREETRAKAEAGEEIDREAVMAAMREIQQTAFQTVYDDVLTEAQQKLVDERRAEMEKRRAEREEQRRNGEGPAEGERPARPGRGEGRQGGQGGERPARPGRDGGDDLDL